MVDKGSYYYTDQLISRNSTYTNTNHHLISYLSLSVNSPLILSQWQQELYHHSDKRYTKYILQGIEEGFKIGFNNFHILQLSTSNLPTPNPSTIYWESFMEENICEFRGFWNNRECFLATIFSFNCLD